MSDSTVDSATIPELSLTTLEMVQKSPHHAPPGSEGALKDGTFSLLFGSAIVGFKGVKATTPPPPEHPTPTIWGPLFGRPRGSNITNYSPPQLFCRSAGEDATSSQSRQVAGGTRSDVPSGAAQLTVKAQIKRIFSNPKSLAGSSAAVFYSVKKGRTNRATT